jgi:hypothetical protein
MYRVVDSKGNTVALCSRKEDAAAYLKDEEGKTYKIILDR